jgi:hypothetical protein
MLAFSAFQISSRSANSRSSLSDLLVEHLRADLRRGVAVFLLDRLPLDLELDQAAVETIHGLGL